LGRAEEKFFFSFSRAHQKQQLPGSRGTEADQGGKPALLQCSPLFCSVCRKFARLEAGSLAAQALDGKRGSPSLTSVPSPPALQRWHDTWYCPRNELFFALLLSFWGLSLGGKKEKSRHPGLHASPILQISDIPSETAEADQQRGQRAAGAAAAKLHVPQRHFFWSLSERANDRSKKRRTRPPSGLAWETTRMLDMSADGRLLDRLDGLLAYPGSSAQEPVVPTGPPAWGWEGLEAPAAPALPLRCTPRKVELVGSCDGLERGPENSSWDP
jgi:hypothetical protein